ncbi:hypothetical protein FOA52_014732 [Chlamydomonas sp. UWO 241]|nr:hypothetical protein FOA52_014732 [Chlamydomonas sp. UWO 241]
MKEFLWERARDTWVSWKVLAGIGAVLALTLAALAADFTLPPLRALPAAGQTLLFTCLAAAAWAVSAPVKYVCVLYKARTYLRTSDMQDIQANWASVADRAFWVAEHEGRVVGATALRMEVGEPAKGSHWSALAERDAELLRMTVCASARRLGVGSLLLKAAEAHAARAGRVRVTLITGAIPAMSFYARCGYARTQSYPSGAGKFTKDGLPVGPGLQHQLPIIEEEADDGGGGSDHGSYGHGAGDGDDDDDGAGSDGGAGSAGGAMAVIAAAAAAAAAGPSDEHAARHKRALRTDRQTQGRMLQLDAERRALEGRRELQAAAAVGAAAAAVGEAALLAALLADERMLDASQTTGRKRGGGDEEPDAAADAPLDTPVGLSQPEPRRGEAAPEAAEDGEEGRRVARRTTGGEEGDAAVPAAAPAAAGGGAGAEDAAGGGGAGGAGAGGGGGQTQALATTGGAAGRGDDGGDWVRGKVHAFAYARGGPCIGPVDNPGIRSGLTDAIHCGKFLTATAAEEWIMNILHGHPVQSPDPKKQGGPQGWPMEHAVADAAGALVVTPAEVRAAATHSKPGTAPGPDGIPVDVWRKLGEPAFELLAAVFTAVGATGGTPPGFLDGVVASIYKAKNAADAANYRPLTMLGSDYRILAKVLATRWTPLLSAVVGPEQTAFLAGRRISDNICLTQMLPGLLAANAADDVGPTGAALALLDFRKAYDTIDRGFLIAVMEAVGVGDGVLAWTRTILTHTYASAEVNGFISAPRKYAAGMRQGCPAAPALFLFLGHALACFLRTCPAVGVEVVPGCRVTCPQYADDCMPLLRSCAPADVAALVETMAVFGRATGLVLNLGKCGILPLGSAGEGLLAGAEVAGLRVLDAGVSLGVPVSAGLPPPEGVTGALGPVARITGRVQTAELWGAEAPLWANPLLQLELPAAQRSVQWREPTGDAAGHALFSPTDAARWLVDGLARVRDALPGMRTVTDLCVLWAWLAAVDMVFAGLRGLEAAVPTLWRMPLLNARKEPIWRLWPPARSVAVERAGELATMDLWDALASFAEGGGMPRGWAGVVGPTHPFVGVVDGGLTLNKTS